MYNITTNASGSRHIEVSDTHLQTIRRYGLLDHLTDSNGIVNEGVLDKLKLNIRSLISSEEGDCKDLLDLCLDVVYHKNMKAIGLQNLITLYDKWAAEHPETPQE